MSSKRATRSREYRRGRALILTDAKAVRHVYRRSVCQGAAYQLAGACRLKFRYIPSEENPADAPSPGVRVRHRRPGFPRTVFRSAFEKRLGGFREVAWTKQGLAG